MSGIDFIKSKIRTISDFPKPGIEFRDSTTLIKDANAFNQTINELCNQWPDEEYDAIVAIDARGFIFGSALAYKNQKGLVLARKQGKLPAKTSSESYALEYGEDKIEIHDDSIEKGKRYLILDDLIATGGTAAATCKIVDRLGGIVAGCGFVIELSALKGRDSIKCQNIRSLIQY
jgi:adenine phosphoribosyltransferase